MTSKTIETDGLDLSVLSKFELRFDLLKKGGRDFEMLLGNNIGRFKIDLEEIGVKSPNKLGERLHHLRTE